MEVVFVVNEIDLDPGRRNRCDLDYKRSVNFVDDDIHTGKTDHLMELILSLFDTAISWHEASDFLLSFLYALRQVSSDICDIGFRQIRKHFRVDEQDSFDRIIHTHYI